ncbi:hypothetical protein AAHA92_21910 [Salvia divinorum]|uniref:Uncharacterized protein n=1 Tax=Salvia divinorum TaxID=28513 RepID=A0ABD1GPV9_SALDI
MKRLPLLFLFLVSLILVAFQHLNRQQQIATASYYKGNQGGNTNKVMISTETERLHMSRRLERHHLDPAQLEITVHHQRPD